MVQKLPLTDPKPGDVLVFKKTGAYSCMEGMLLFLSHSLPKIMLYNNTDGFRQVRKAYKTYKWNTVIDQGCFIFPVYSIINII